MLVRRWLVRNTGTVFVQVSLLLEQLSSSKLKAERMIADIKGKAGDKRNHSMLSYLGTVSYCTIPHSTVLYRTVPYCTVLYRTVPYCTVRYRTVPYGTLLYRAPPYHTLLYCTALYCMVPCCTVVYCMVPYCTVLYCNLIIPCSTS